MGQYLSLLIYTLSTAEVIPWNMPVYTEQLRVYYSTLQAVVNGTGKSLDLSRLSSAISTFDTAAQQVASLSVRAQASSDPALIDLVNHKFRDFQRGFVSQGGLPDREFYKHVVNAPGVDTGYAPVTYPGITEAVQAGNFTLAAAWVERTARGIERAAAILAT